MNKHAKEFLLKVRTLDIKVKLSPDKTFVIFDPSLPTDLIQIAIDLTDDLCKILDNEEMLLSSQDEDLIRSLVEDDEDMLHSSFKLIGNQTEKENLPIVYEQYTTESFDNDFDFIRKNLKDVINSGTEALQKMIEVANASMHPRAYEVVATLMKSLSDINKDLLDSHKKKLEVNQLSGTNNTTNNTNIQNNVIFSGSTSELAKLLKGKNK